MSVLKKLIMGSAWGMYNKPLGHIIGLHPAILLSEIASKEGYFEGRGELKDGWFFNTVEDMEKDTCLSKFQQAEGIKVLVNERLIEYKVKGLPAKRYFRITVVNENNFLKLLSTNKQVPITSYLESKELEPEKLKGNNLNLNKNKYDNNNKPLIKFNYETEKWENITEEYGAELKMRFPGLNLKEEFWDIRDWLIDHADKPKKNFRSLINKWLKNSEGSPKEEVVSMEESLKQMEEDNGGGLIDEQLAGGCYVTFPEDYDYVKENAYLEVIKKAKDKEKAIKALINKIDDIECERLIKMTYKQWDEFQRQYPNGDGNRSELYSQIVDIIVARDMAEAGM